VNGPQQKFTIRRVTAGNTALLDNVAPGVFDEEIDTEHQAVWTKSAGHLMVMALLDGTVVGMCTAMLHRHADKVTELYVDEVGVAEDYRRQGLGRRMMDEMFKWGVGRGCKETWVATEPDNLPARGLYESLAGGEFNECVFYTYKLTKE
jgi:ribosomal protein S18 acetylase RimI-like enzyme